MAGTKTARRRQFWVYYGQFRRRGFLLAEQVAIAILQDMVDTYAEDIGGFRFTLMDGTPVTIGTRS
jgi:hypothetical protein